jgi:hypothetical protein
MFLRQGDVLANDRAWRRPYLVIILLTFISLHADKMMLLCPRNRQVGSTMAKVRLDTKRQDYGCI